MQIEIIGVSTALSEFLSSADKVGGNFFYLLDRPCENLPETSDDMAILYEKLRTNQKQALDIPLFRQQGWEEKNANEMALDFMKAHLDQIELRAQVVRKFLHSDGAASGADYMRLKFGFSAIISLEPEECENIIFGKIDIQEQVALKSCIDCLLRLCNLYGGIGFLIHPEIGTSDEFIAVTSDRVEHFAVGTDGNSLGQSRGALRFRLGLS